MHGVSTLHRFYVFTYYYYQYVFDCLILLRIKCLKIENIVFTITTKLAQFIQTWEMTKVQNECCSQIASCGGTEYLS